jgi:outer membrane protein TolC
MAKVLSDPRRRLLEAGLKQFANRGYAGTSVQDITDEAKVTKPTLYYYFQSKEGLFQALVDQALDERLRLMREAAPPGMETVEQLTGIVVAVTNFARQQPDLWRLCFSIAFAAPEEFPSGFKRHHKMHESIRFVHEIIASGLERNVLNSAFKVEELTMAFFNLIQHTTVISIFESRFERMKARGNAQFPPPPPPMAPRRMVELFLVGASARNGAPPPIQQRSQPKPKRLAATALLLALSLLTAQAQTSPESGTNTAPMALATNAPPAAETAMAETNAPPSAPATSAASADNSPFVQDTLVTNNAPDLATVRPVPAAVRASHPELATVSPVAQNALDPRALDLQTCFLDTAIRDDSLKISLQDVYIAQAQLSQSLAALWPSFTGSNQQQFYHYRKGGNENAVTIINNSPVQGNRTYTSQSNISMTYTVFNGGQNWNNLAASDAAIAAKRQTLARDYQTIYQDVAQAFYDVLQYEGDMDIQADLIDALQARVDDLRDRVRLGRSRPSELLQAQTDLANARETYEQQRGSLNAAKETLAFYIGVPSGQFKLKDTQKFPSAGQLEAYVTSSVARPDVLSQLDSLRQAERQLSSAEGQLWPTVTANGNFLASQDPVSNEINGTMTIEVSMPIFDGGLIIGQIHQNKELVRQSRLNVEQLQRTSDEDTRTAYANFEASAAQVVVLREAAQLAAKNIEAQVDDYRRGVVSNLDVLTALQDYQSARQGLHDANMQARLNLINLNVAAGLAATGPNANNQALPTSSGRAP